MAKVYTEEELNSFSRETLMAVILSTQDQISQLSIPLRNITWQFMPAGITRRS